VSEKLSDDYGENFVYFAFTDAKIDWYSGEESEPICGSLQHKLPGVDQPTPRDAYLLQSSTPCTCALYSGATVMFKTDENRASDAGNDPSGATSEILEPKIASALTDGLVPLLHEDEPTGEDSRRRPFYTELKGASVSWTAAQRQQGGKLVYVDAKEPPPEGTEQLAPSESSDNNSNPATILDEGVEDSTTIEVIGVNALEAGAIQEQKANAFSTTRGKILASVLGALVCVSLVALFVRLCYKKNQRKKEQARTGKASDQNTVITESPDAVDVEIAGASSSRRKGSIGSASSADSDDLSANAQYKTPGKIMDTISVGSEWTLTTGVTDGVASALGLQSTGSKTLAEMMAAKETFDRDRQITLQKDMLQSEWSGAINPPSGLALSRVSSRPIGNNNNQKASSKTTRHEEPNGLQFEMAGG